MEHGEWSSNTCYSLCCRSVRRYTQSPLRAAHFPDRVDPEIPLFFQTMSPPLPNLYLNSHLLKPAAYSNIIPPASTLLEPRRELHAAIQTAPPLGTHTHTHTHTHKRSPIALCLWGQVAVGVTSHAMSDIAAQGVRPIAEACFCNPSPSHPSYLHNPPSHTATLLILPTST